MSDISMIVCAVIPLAWAAVGLYAYRCQRRLNEWRARCDDFISKQSELDHELDRIWELLHHE